MSKFYRWLLADHSPLTAEHASLVTKWLEDTPMRPERINLETAVDPVSMAQHHCPKVDRNEVSFPKE